MGVCSLLLWLVKNFVRLQGVRKAKNYKIIKKKKKSIERKEKENKNKNKRQVAHIILALC